MDQYAAVTTAHCPERHPCVACWLERWAIGRLCVVCDEEITFGQPFVADPDPPGRVAHAACWTDVVQDELRLAAVS